MLMLLHSALHNAWSPILASIFAGNAVVLKCSEHVIWSTSWFVGAIEECLRKCGHNPDIVQVRPQPQPFSICFANLTVECLLLARTSKGTHAVPVHQTHHLHWLRKSWASGMIIRSVECCSCADACTADRCRCHQAFDTSLPRTWWQGSCYHSP